MKTITRRELYDLLWSKSISKISKETNIKESIIRGICQTYKIPLPINGYWSKATDYERLDVNNGLLLSPTYDALFDKHLITFDNKGKIQLSDKIENSAYQKIGVTGREQIHDLSMYNVNYLDRHNQIFI